MRRALVAFVAAGALLVPLPAEARLHEVDVANYYFEEVETGARDPIVVDKGDQIRFTIRQAAYPPHSIVIDEYGIDSGQLLLFQTYTTPPLDKPGTFALYCRAHRPEPRGHETRLVVKAAPAPSAPSSAQPSTPASTQRPRSQGSATATPQAGASGTAAPSPVPSTPGETLAPVGVDVAADRRRAAPEPDSLAGLLGRRFGEGAPWTSAVWMWLLSALPIAGGAAYAMRRELRRR